MVESTLIPGFSRDIVAKHIMSKEVQPIMVVTPNPSQYINYIVFLRVFYGSLLYL